MPIFLDDRYHHRFLEAVFYYRHQRPPIRYSYFSRLPQSVKSETLLKLDQLQKFFVEIICYCLMPNHFHFLLKQTTDNGISEFMRRFSESYTHYFNVKNKRIGPIFQGRFKSIRIETEQQLLHTSRYIHLNPYSAGIVKSMEELQEYSYSSLPEYLGINQNKICQKDIILDYFRNSGSYDEFISNEAEYQRELSMIKHVMLENPEGE